jgi:tetratricopeptide (TPR) repeat protein
MTVRRFNLTRVAVVFIICVAVWAVPLPGQPSNPERSRPGENAEEMVETALQKIEAGELDQARALIMRAGQLKGHLAKLDLAEGLLLMVMQPPRYPDAIRSLQKYTTSNEGRNDYRGFASLGAIYKESRTYRNAIGPLEQARKLAPAEENGKFVRAEITIDLAFCYLGLENKKKALETAKEAEASAPSDPRILLGLARVALAIDESAVAEPALKKAIDLLKMKIQAQPFDEGAHNTLQGCYDVSIRLRKNALRALPDDAALCFALASTMRDYADVARRINLLGARQFALHAIEKEPKKYEWQVFAARLEADLGAYPEAKQRLNDILKESPENQEAAKLLETLQAQPAAGKSAQQ